MRYEITRTGVTYTVEPYVDDGDLFAIISSVSGLEQYGSDELAALFNDDVHWHLARDLEKILKEEDDEV